MKEIRCAEVGFFPDCDRRHARRQRRRGDGGGCRARTRRPRHDRRGLHRRERGDHPVSHQGRVGVAPPSSWQNSTLGIHGAKSRRAVSTIRQCARPCSCNRSRPSAAGRPARCGWVGSMNFNCARARSVRQLRGYERCASASVCLSAGLCEWCWLTGTTHRNRLKPGFLHQQLGSHPHRFHAPDASAARVESAART